ncbi:MAG: glycerol-3-phosphate 1-O-acyltransferase PlsY [Planctomycetes bacterium]|nr:glycerol-3-phosphate 1-O-acyltransferase PlsY [Planctomycetota bacterium]
MLSWLLLPVTYLFGSVSFAWLAARAKGIDLRSHGSGNLGATNAGRVLGRKWFFIIFSADLAKGLLPVLVALALVESGHAHGTLPVLTAACAILGHSFTCFHGFKGGKAVATSLGVLIGLVYLAAAITFGIWLLVWAVCYTVFRLKASDAVGPASVIAALAMPFAHLATFPQPWALLNLPLTIFLFLVATLVIVRHRSNIAKLLGKTPPPAE